MKSLYYYLALGCFCLSTVSCEDFLKETLSSTYKCNFLGADNKQ